MNYQKSIIPLTKYLFLRLLEKADEMQESPEKEE